MFPKDIAYYCEYRTRSRMSVMKSILNSACFAETKKSSSSETRHKCSRTFVRLQGKNTKYIIIMFVAKLVLGSFYNITILNNVNLIVISNLYKQRLFYL